MNRATSKASYRETRETNEASQSKNILKIIFTGGDWTLQELIEEYQARWNVRIDSGVMSARMNKLKNEDEPKIKESSPRKCPISKRTVTPLTENNCTHERYKSKDYMMYSNAAKAHDRNEVKIIGTPVINCEDCGADISHAKRVKVKAIENKINKPKATAKKYIITIRGEEASMICLQGESIEEAKKECEVKFGKHFEGIRE